MRSSSGRAYNLPGVPEQLLHTRLHRTRIALVGPAHATVLCTHAPPHAPPPPLPRFLCVLAPCAPCWLTPSACGTSFGVQLPLYSYGHCCAQPELERVVYASDDWLCLSSYDTLLSTTGTHSTLCASRFPTPPLTSRWCVGPRSLDVVAGAGTGHGRAGHQASADGPGPHRRGSWPGHPHQLLRSRPFAQTALLKKSLSCCRSCC